MKKPSIPVLYSNDTCPYAFRARLALQYSAIEVEHREIKFDNKPPSMLEASPKGSVPTMVFADGSVIDQSWDIVRWALGQNDPENWSGADNAALESAQELVEQNDGDFSSYAYYYQCANDNPERNAQDDRAKAEPFARELENRLIDRPCLNGMDLGVADMAVFPFVQDFCGVDTDWFSAAFPNLYDWLERVSATELVKKVSARHETWAF